MGPRQPAQSRSRATREAVVDAASRLAASEHRELSAQAIAQEAGVAVGTLYQYFEGVDAVLDTVVERHLDRFEAVIHDSLEAAAPATLVEASLAVTEAFIVYYAKEPGFHALWFGPRFSPQHKALDAANNPRLARAMYEELVVRGFLPAHPDVAKIVAANWEVADVLISLAFRISPEGDPLVLDHLRWIMNFVGRPAPTPGRVPADPIPTDAGPADLIPAESIPAGP